MTATNKPLRLLSVITMSVALLVTTSASAGIGRSSGSKSGSSGGGYSAPKKSSTVSPGSNRSSSTDSGRVGGGRSAGMTRDSTMNSIRNDSRSASNSGYSAPQRQTVAPAQGAPSQSSFRPSQNYAAPAAPSPARNSGSSWVAPALAGAAVGAVAGYAISNNNDRTQHQAPLQGQHSTEQGGVTLPRVETSAPVAPLPQPVSKAQPELNEGTMGFGWLMGALLGLGVVIGLLVLAMRKEKHKNPLGVAAFGSKEPSRPSSSPRTSSVSNQPASATGFSSQSVSASAPSRETKREVENLLNSEAQHLYRHLQQLNNEGDLRSLKALSTAEMYDFLREEIERRAEASQTEVLAVYRHEVRDVEETPTQWIASIWYEAENDEHDGEGPARVEEVFHFVKDKNSGSPWKLSGIEQLD